MQQSLKDFIELLSIPIACRTGKYLEGSASSMGSSGHGHSGPCQTLKLFNTAGPMLQDPESPGWDPPTLLIVE